MVDPVDRPAEQEVLDPELDGRTKVKTPSMNSFGSATSAKTLNTVPSLDTCAVRRGR